MAKKSKILKNRKKSPRKNIKSPGIPKDLIKRLRKIRCLATDVDGVLTDGHIWLDTSGEWRRQFYIRDGLGIVYLRKAGYQLAFITTSRSQDIAARAKNLEIHHTFDGAHDKDAAFTELLRRTGFKPEEIAFVGDDIIDLPVFRRCGLAIAVADAMPDVIAESHWVSNFDGGRGAIREVCDLLLKHGALGTPKAGQKTKGAL